MLISHFCNVQLGLGFVLAEDKLSGNDNLSKLFYECKDYIVATCQKSVWNDKMDDLCQVGSIVHSCLDVSTNGMTGIFKHIVLMSNAYDKLDAFIKC